VEHGANVAGGVSHSETTNHEVTGTANDHGNGTGGMVASGVAHGGEAETPHVWADANHEGAPNQELSDYQNALADQMEAANNNDFAHEVAANGDAMINGTFDALPNHPTPDLGPMPVDGVYVTVQDGESMAVVRDGLGNTIDDGVGLRMSDGTPVLTNNGFDNAFHPTNDSPILQPTTHEVCSWDAGAVIQSAAIDANVGGLNFHADKDGPTLNQTHEATGLKIVTYENTTSADGSNTTGAGVDIGLGNVNGSVTHDANGNITSASGAIEGTLWKVVTIGGGTNYVDGKWSGDAHVGVAVPMPAGMPQVDATLSIDPFAQKCEDVPDWKYVTGGDF